MARRPGEPEPWRLMRVEEVMGMPIGIDVRDPGFDPAPVEDAFAWLRHVDDTFSTYRDDSEISRLNAGDLTPAELSDEVRGVLERCEALRAGTGGYFDARAPLAAGAGEGPRPLDPSGLVKGWSLEGAAEILERAGARNFSVNAGGDVVLRGAALPEPVWRIGIQHPLERDAVAAILALTDIAIATSGTYERGSHIVDPVSGGRPEGLLSMTIVGPDLGSADAYSTAAFAMGRRGPEWAAGLPGYESMAILAEGRVLSTPGLPRADA